MKHIDITLSEYVYDQAIDFKRKTLTISPEYFKIKSSLARRIYLIARKQVGKQGYWDIGVENLKLRSGSMVARARQFEGELIEIIEKNKIPDFQLSFLSNGNVRIYSRDARELTRRLAKRK